MYRAIAKNKRNTVFIILLFLLIIGGLGFLASVIYNDLTIVIITLVVATGYALIQYFAAGSQALALSGAHQIQKSDNPRLYRIVENLSITTGTPMPKVYIIDDPSPNAFATGRDPQHASVAATTGLLELLDDSELEGVMAHEIGHVQNYDIRVSMIVFGLVVAVGFIADMLLRMSFFGGRGNNSNPAVLVLGLAAFIIAQGRGVAPARVSGGCHGRPHDAPPGSPCQRAHQARAIRQADAAPKLHDGAHVDL
jgi:heat shock protein HtpX